MEIEDLAKSFETLATNSEAEAHENLAKDFENITRGRWEWKSNSDPWLENEPEQWELYSLEHNYLIEKAYYDQQKEVDIGDYIISTKHMIQKKKGYVIRQRPIRRRSWIDSVHEKHRNDRYLETELPKTINQVFGSLGDFISFFSRRNTDIWDFTNQFKELEQSHDFSILNQKITPKLVACFEEVLLKPKEEQLKNPSLSAFQKNLLSKRKKPIEELIGMFKRELLSFEEFYGQTLRAYSMNTDLYPVLNNSLRNENWVEADKLLPYAFCLYKAFFSLRLQTNSTQESEVEPKTQSSMLLYRGTAFDELALSFYNREKAQYFSWNSITSTSRNKKIAEDFMYKTVDITTKKFPVLFVIEIPLMTEFEPEYSKWLDIQQYSAIPKEDEVILAPGSVFELIKLFTNKDQKTTIKIKLRNEIKSLVHGGMMMQGTLQNQMATEKEMKVICAEGEELSQALMSLCGNKLIEELEFCLCTFNKKSLSKMFEVLPTLEKVKILKFIACMYQDNGEITIEGSQETGRCGITKIEVIEMVSFFQMICNEKHNQGYWGSLKELDLDFRSRPNLKDEELNAAISQRLKYLPQLTSLNINCKRCSQLTDDGVISLAKELKTLDQLTQLNLSFERCEQITVDRGVKNLAQGLDSFIQLTDLNSNFAIGKDITEEGLNNLAQTLNYFMQSTDLIPNFTIDKNITEEGLNSLAEALNSLAQLTHFNFHSHEWDEINDKEASSLTRLLSSLTQITHLNIHFNILANEAMIILAKGLDSLTNLTDLSFCFECCDQITDDGVASFAKEFNSFTQLTHLNLQFRSCQRITDAGVKSLAERLSSHNQLTCLNLDFRYCNQLTDDGVTSFGEILSSLIQLTHLNLGLWFCKQITDVGVESLARGLSFLTELTHLNLEFRSCEQIMNAGMKSLAEGLESLKQLTHLYLGLTLCKQITDAGVKSLGEALNPLLTHLHLEFQWCKHITNDGVNSLAQGINSLTELTHLHLNFDSCYKITDDGVSILMSQGLQNLTQLTFLILDFDDCDEIISDIHFLACKWLKHLRLFPSLIVKYQRLQNIGTSPKQKMFGSSRIRLVRESSYEKKQTLHEAVSPLEMGSTFSESSEESDKFLTQNMMDAFVFTEEETEGTTDSMASTLKVSETFFKVCHLTSLTFDFGEHSHLVTDKIIENLSFQVLGNLPLRSLTLSFKDCKLITDEGVGDLALCGLRPLTDLASLNLDFSSCSGITDKGVNALGWEGLRHLSQLKALVLNFSGCDNTTNKGYIHLAWNGLRYLSQLETLDLSPHWEITDTGIDGLTSHCFKSLTRLKFLTLNFFCSRITDQGVNNLILRIVKKLPQLAFLDLNLNECKNVSDLTEQNITKVLHYFGFTKELYDKYGLD